MAQPKILILDIETSPLLGYAWGLWENNIALNQIHTDWCVLGFGAKWRGESKMFYADQRKGVSKQNERKVLEASWRLLDEAQVVVTQNGKAFDEKKLNARFVIHGFQPPSPYKRYDTKLMAKKCFGFTSNKLEYMADNLNTKYKKLKHEKFAGFELWRQCLAGNQEAWKEMERYNKHDVLALEELYERLVPWDTGVNYNVFNDGAENACKCGSKKFERRGFAYTNAGKYQQYRCNGCGAWTRGRTNLFSTGKKSALHAGLVR